MENENTEYKDGDHNSFKEYVFTEEPKSPNTIKLELGSPLGSNNINKHMREIDKNIAENSIIFLKKSSQETYLSDIKVAIFKLIENQIQTLTLVESTEDYIFKSIVSAIAPEKKSRPSRSLICIMGTFLGLMMGIVISLVLHYFNFNINSRMPSCASESEDLFRTINLYVQYDKTRIKKLPFY